MHPDDVYSGEVHVAGRDLHFVCGMSCHETVAKITKTGKVKEGSFHLQRLIREADEGRILHVCRGKIRKEY